MITDFLLEHAELMPIALILTALACVGVGYVLLRSPRYGNRIMWTLAALSLLVILALALVPSGRSGSGGFICTVQFSYPTFTRVELAANVAVFFPAVYFATLATRRPVFTLAAGSAVSVAIEAVQALVPAIGRACDTNDWLMNTLGTVAGVLLALGTSALADNVSPRFSRDHQPQSGDPS